MRRILKLFACLTALAALAGAASAQDGEAEEAEVNLLENYHQLEWQGDQLYYDDSSGAVFFGKTEASDQPAASAQSAMLEIELGDATGFFFRIDGGNGSNNSDTGYCTLSFYDESGAELFSVSTGIISKLDNYSRYYIGSEESYFPVPENAEKAVIALNAVQADGDSRVNVYFRNLALYLSSEKPLAEDNSPTFMSVTSGLAKVEVGLSDISRWIWIGIIAAVAVMFYSVKVKIQKYKSVDK